MHEGSRPTISIILPALTADDRYLRCVYSIRSAFRGKTSYEIITIVPDVEAFRGWEADDLTLVPEIGPGIYRAMNTCLNRACGQYLYFIGQDDILLPEAGSALLKGAREGADLVLADVYWGRLGIFRNWTPRQTLVWRNWCHQGIFYSRDKFLREVGAFESRFKTQADHFANIVMTRNPDLKLTRYRGCIAWYSASGLSARSPDLEFRKAFPSIVRTHFGQLSYVVVKCRRVLLVLLNAIGRNQ